MQRPSCPYSLQGSWRQLARLYGPTARARSSLSLRRLRSLQSAAPLSAAQPSSVGVDEAATQYPFREVEERWQRYWEQHATFRTPHAVDTSKPKFYALDMFPYPSGAGLHVGHPEGYTATDIIARFKRMKGYNVLHPMGWDAFGLPAEQYALDTGTHPNDTTRKNIDRFRQQLKSLGFSYDWERELATCDASYYRWTQWIFLRLHERGLAYQAEVPVNWCPALGTVLANEEVIDGLSERGSHPVIRKPMRQWMLRITAYADRLLDDLESLDWPESIKDMQRNWIGRSVGVSLRFEVADGSVAGKQVEVFTTRPETLFGVSYVVVAPEHPLALDLATAERREAVASYIESASRKNDLERTELAKEKSGVWTGSHVLNPASGKRVPVWVADYVLGGYGSGAVMAVPAHDSRDYDFALRFGLPVLPVVRDASSLEKSDSLPFTGDGEMVNSGNESSVSLDGLTTAAAADAVASWLEGCGLGTRKVNYKLRDWLFARQRYWGEPFPVVFPEGSDTAVRLRDGARLSRLLSKLPPDAGAEDLPLLLPPTNNFRPSGDGEGPLANLAEWVQTTIPGTDAPARRETNTMPQWAGSCWYYLRFVNPTNDVALISSELERYWMPVDLYVGGAEHAVLHLLYARFWHKVLFDLGVVSTKEPFQKLVSQGMILGEVEFTMQRDSQSSGLETVKLSTEEVLKKGDGYVLKADPSIRVTARAHKMSKSRGNVVNPDDVIAAYGADSLRLYEMFMGPLRETKTWSTRSVDGVYRFLCRTWRLFEAHRGESSEVLPSAEQLRVLHTAIKKVTEDTEEMRFNTAISAMMELCNAATKWDNCPRSILESYTLLLAPYAPHIAEELWYRLGKTQSLAYEPWPVYDASVLVEMEVQLGIQVNGKLRATVSVPADCSEQFALDAARNGAAKWLDGLTVTREIYVRAGGRGRLVNFVAQQRLC